MEAYIVAPLRRKAHGWVIGVYLHLHISLPKRKPPSSQSELLFQEILLLRKAVIGRLAVFFLVLKLGGTSDKNHPVFDVIQTNIFDMI